MKRAHFPQNKANLHKFYKTTPRVVKGGASFGVCLFANNSRLRQVTVILETVILDKGTPLEVGVESGITLKDLM